MGFMHNKFRKYKTTEQISPLPVKREVLLPTVAKSLLIGSHLIVEFPLKIKMRLSGKKTLINLWS